MVEHKATALAGSVAARIVCTLLGGWLAAIIPVELVAQSQRTANMASDYAPNMDPNVLMSLATLMATPVLVAALLVELVRFWVMDGTRLAVISHATLGVIAATPIGYTLAVPEAQLGYPALLALTSLGIALFYATRRVWQLIRARSVDSSAA